MLKLIVERIRQPIDSAIHALVARVMMAIPLLIALIYAASALRTFLASLWGPIGADLAMAGGFALVAAVAWLALSAGSDKNPADAPAREERAGDDHRRHGAQTDKDEGPVTTAAGAIDGLIASVSAHLPLRPQDREVAVAVMTAAVPIAAPKLIKFALRHLPVTVMAGAALYAVSRLRQPARPGRARR